MAACYSTPSSYPAAPPTGSTAFSPAQLCSPVPFALPVGCLLPPEYLYLPPQLPSSCGVAVGGLTHTGSGSAVVAPAPFFPWLQVPLLPSCPVPLYRNNPSPPRVLPAARCGITEIIDDGSLRPSKVEVEYVASPRSVLAPCRAAGPASPRVPKQTAAVPHLSSGVGTSRPPAFDRSSKKTSLMICNIPNSFLKRRLMAILDQHCAEENKLLYLPGGEVVKSEYDFLYVPIDFRTKCNKGYAFVNMTTPTAAWRLHEFLHGHRWPCSGKVCEVVHADIQGVDALARNFSRSMFPCGGNKEFLPVRFGPPRDGPRPTAERVMGHALVRYRGWPRSPARLKPAV